MFVQRMERHRQAVDSFFPFPRRAAGCTMAASCSGRGLRQSSRRHRHPRRGATVECHRSQTTGGRVVCYVDTNSDFFPDYRESPHSLRSRGSLPARDDCQSYRRRLPQRPPPGTAHGRERLPHWENPCRQGVVCMRHVEAGVAAGVRLQLQWVSARPARHPPALVLQWWQHV